MNTVTFTEKGGRRTRTVLVQHTSQQHRDAQIRFGMEESLQEAMDLSVPMTRKYSEIV